MSLHYYYKMLQQNSKTKLGSKEFFLQCLHMSLSIMSLIICIGISPSVRIASLFGSGLMKNRVGRPRT